MTAAAASAYHPQDSATAVPIERTLENGLRVHVRPIQPTDRAALRRGFHRLREQGDIEVAGGGR